MGEIARLMAHDMSDRETATLVQEMTPVWTRTPDHVLRSSMERVDRADLAAYLAFLARAAAVCRRAEAGAESLLQIARRARLAGEILETSRDDPAPKAW